MFDQYLDTWVVCSVRYALGRSTYIVSEIASSVKSAWPHIQNATKNVILRDIEEALRRTDGGLLGMKCDHDTWSELKNWIVQSGPNDY